MRTRIGLLVLVVLSGVLNAQRLRPAAPEEVGISSRRLRQVDGVIEAAIAGGETPGAVLLVARRGGVAYRKAYGHRALQPRAEEMTPDTIFDVASLTKVMATATSVMILVEEGRISLWDPVSRHLPRFAGNGKERVTVLQLLTHYSGLRPDLDLDEPWSGYDTALRRAYGETLAAEPGKKFIYSDINYFLLGELVRRTSGLHLHEFSAARIFGPLKMADTGFLPSPSLRPRIAPTERREGAMLRGQVHDPTSFRMGGCAGHAGLFSTVDDTAVFAQMILNRGRYNGVRVLSPYSVRRMTTPQSPAGKPDWRGIGFDIRTPFSSVRGDLYPVGSFGHTGFTGTSLWIDPESESFVVLFTNRLHPEGKGNVVSLRRRVASVVAASIEDSR